MTTLRRRATRSAMMLLLGAGGCAGAGNVGDILGGVLGGSGAGQGGQGSQVSGTVGQVDRQNGLFALDVRGYGTVVVALPYNVGRADLNTFQSLRQGDRVRLHGVFLNDTRVELRQFY